MNKKIILILFFIMVFSMSVSATSPLSTTNTSLLFYYKMDEASGNLVDSIDNGRTTHDATAVHSPATYQDNKTTNYSAYSIDLGGTGYFTQESADLKDYFGASLQTFTLGFSFRFEDVGGGDPWGVVSWLYYGAGFGGFGCLVWEEQNYLLCGTYDGDDYIQSPALVDGQNYTFIITFDGSNIRGYIKTGLDGNPTTSGTHADSYIVPPTPQPLLIGTHNSTGNVKGNLSSSVSEVWMLNESMPQATAYRILSEGIYSVGINNPSTPTIELPTLTDGYTSSINETLNVSHTTALNDVRYYLYFGTSSTLSESDLYLNNATRNASEWKSFYTNVTDGTYYYKWRVQNTSNGLFSENTTQRSLIINTIKPIITLNGGNSFNASNVSTIDQYADYLYLNFSITDQIEISNFTINITRRGISYFNYTNTSLGIGNRTYNFTKNLSISTWASGVYLINISVDGNSTVELYKWFKGNYSITFTDPIQFGDIGTFILNMSSNSSFVTLNASFYYDGILRSATKTSATEYTSWVSSFTIPESNGTTENKSFHWFVNVTQPRDGKKYAINFSRGQIVNNFYIDNCSLKDIISINVSLLNESDDSLIMGDMDFLFSYNSSNNFRNYSTDAYDNNISFCIYPNSTRFTADIDIDYLVGGTTFEYHAIDYVMTNITQLINLYATSGTTRVTFTVTDLYDDAVENAYIKIIKYDVGDNLYRTVEVIKTNGDGEAVGKFANYDITQGVYTTLNYTESTNNFAYTWIDSSGSMHYGCLLVTLSNMTWETDICDSCTLSTSATILCNIGSNPNGIYTAQGYLKFDDLYMTNYLQKTFGTWGNFTGLWEQGEEEKEFGVFLTFMLVVSLIMLGVWSPVTAITLCLVGIFISSKLGFINLQIGSFVSLVILGVVVIYKISRR